MTVRVFALILQPSVDRSSCQRVRAGDERMHDDGFCMHWNINLDRTDSLLVSCAAEQYILRLSQMIDIRYLPSRRYPRCDMYTYIVAARMRAERYHWDVPVTVVDQAADHTA